MEHSQVVIRYRPKYQKLNKWCTEYNTLQQYISFNASTNIANTTDSSQITFSQKKFFSGVGQYNSATNVITCLDADWKINEWRWFTLVDANHNRFKILSNTKNTLKLVPTIEFNYPGLPTPKSFSIELPLFDIGDLFDVYVWKVTDNNFTELVSEDDLVFVGQIKSINDRYGNGGVQTTITLENITEVLFKSFNNPKLSSTGSFQTFVDKIKDYILEWVKESNKNLITLKWDPNNPTLKKDKVTPFPNIDYYTDYKPNYEIIAELCQPKYTEDGEYYFYIKPNLNANTEQPEYLFVLRPKKYDLTSKLVEGVDFRLVNRTKDKGDIVTFLIMRCGRDVYGNNVTAYIWGDLKHGTLGKPVAINFAGDIMDWELIKDKEMNGTNFDDEQPPKLPVPLKEKTGSYTTYYYVTKEEAAEYPTYLTEGYFTTDSAKKYNNWVRWLAKAKATIAGRTFLLENNFIKNKVEIEFYNIPISAIPGDVYELTVNSIGWTSSMTGGFNYSKKLRNMSRSVHFTNKGVTTEVTYEEDWEVGTI